MYQKKTKSAMYANIDNRIAYKNRFKSQLRKRNLLKIVLTFAAIWFACTAFAADILTLNNEMVFEGKVTKIKNCEVYFKVERNTYIIPAAEIFSLQFENTKNKIYTNYLKITNNDPNKCLNGSLDAKKYHGKKEVHFVLGVLFGPLAMVGTALANPTPEKGRNTYLMSENKGQFNDPSYLKCYKRKAKGQLITMEGLGWATWLLVLFGTALISGDL
jgi:hypothetical protein